MKFILSGSFSNLQFDRSFNCKIIVISTINRKWNDEALEVLWLRILWFPSSPRAQEELSKTQIGDLSSSAYLEGFHWTKLTALLVVRTAWFSLFWWCVVHHFPYPDIFHHAFWLPIDAWGCILQIYLFFQHCSFWNLYTRCCSWSPFCHFCHLWRVFFCL